MKRLQLVCIALLFLLLASCGVLNQVPPDQAIRLAIAQQQTNIQQEISKGLGLSAQTEPALKFSIDKLTVENRQKLTGSTLSQPGYPDSIYKVRGTFDATLNSSEQAIHQQSPFEVYLGAHSQPERTDKPEADTVETWYLVPPDYVSRPARHPK